MISLDPGVMMPESGRALSHHEAVEMVRDMDLAPQRITINNL